MTTALTLQSNWHLMNAQTLAHVNEYAGLSKKIENKMKISSTQNLT